MVRTRTLFVVVIAMPGFVVLGFIGSANAQSITIQSSGKTKTQGGYTTGPYGTFVPDTTPPPVQHSVQVDYGEYDTQGTFVLKGAPNYPDGHFSPIYGTPNNPQAWAVQAAKLWPTAPTGAAKVRA